MIICVSMKSNLLKFPKSMILFNLIFDSLHGPTMNKFIYFTDLPIFIKYQIKFKLSLSYQIKFAFVSIICINTKLI